MTTFSERIGAFTPPASLHVGTITTELRNSLWNIVLRLFAPRDVWNEAVPHLAEFFFRERVDSLPHYPLQKRDWLRERFYALPWNEALDFVEFLTDHIDEIHEHTSAKPEGLKKVFNALFENEYAGYRFVNGILSPITSPIEAQAIADARSAAEKAGLATVATHIDAALRLLSKRPAPDYRNSVKESISAVESAARQLAPNAAGSGLAGALDDLSKRHGIHPALRKAFVALYGYTSDEGGIRHALLEENVQLEFADAQFMIVACSAFSHYLMLKAEA